MKILPFCMLGVLLASCDKQIDGSESDTHKASDSRTSRNPRQSRDGTLTKRKDLKKLISKALEIESPEARDRELASIIRAGIEIDPKLAAEALGHLPVDSDLRSRTVSYMARYLAEKDPNGALPWAETLNLAKDVLMAKTEICTVLAVSDPEGAANMVLKSGNTTAKLDESAVKVLQIWTGSAPSDAATWVQRLPPGESRNVGIKTVVSQWCQADSRSATSWAAGIVNDATRMEATRAIAEALVETPPPLREIYLGQSDPAIRKVIENQMDQISKKSENKVSEGTR